MQKCCFGLVVLSLVGCASEEGDSGGRGGPADQLYAMGAAAAYEEAAAEFAENGWGEISQADFQTAWDNLEAGGWFSPPEDGNCIPDAATNLGIVYGAAGQAVVGTWGRSVGCDAVWDIAHLQMTTSCWSGTAAQAGASVGVSGFVALASNFTSGATNWFGRFVGAGISIPLPYRLSGDIGFFGTPGGDCMLGLDLDTGVMGGQVGSTWSGSTKWNFFTYSDATWTFDQGSFNIAQQIFRTRTSPTQGPIRFEVHSDYVQFCSDRDFMDALCAHSGFNGAPGCPGLQHYAPTAWITIPRDVRPCD